LNVKEDKTDSLIGKKWGVDFVSTKYRHGILY